MSAGCVDSHEMQEYDSKKVEYIIDKNATAGRGAYGVVIPAFLGSSRLVAVKCFSVHGGPKTEKQVVKQMKAELKKLCLANHEFVVNVYGWAKWPGAVGIVMEYVSGGNLMETLRDDDIILGMLLKLRFCKEIASGLSFIHNAAPNKWLVHGDIKADNIMLTDELHCKIGDFGSAKIVSYTGSLTITGVETGNKFTSLYAAPELLSKPTMELEPWHDTYSYSILVHIILVRELPVRSQLLDIYLKGVMEGKDRPNIKNISGLRSEFTARSQMNEVNIIDNLIEIMESCWDHNPSKRPTMFIVSERLESLFKEFPFEEVKKQVDTAIGEMEFAKPSYDSSKCQQLYHFVDALVSSSIDDPPTSSLVSRSASEPAISPDVVSTPRRSASVFATSNISPNMPTTMEHQEENSQFLSGASPSKNSSSSGRQLLTAEFYEDVLAKLRAIKVFLKNKKSDEAVAQCNLLRSVDASLIPDKGGLTSHVIYVASGFQMVEEHVSSVELVQFALKICNNIEDLKIKISEYVKCQYSLYNSSKALYKLGNKSAIKQHCLPGLKLCYEKLEATPNEEDKEKARQKTMCLLQIGHNHCYIGGYEEAKAASESCLSMMKEAYRNDAKDYRVYALSYELKADSSRALGSDAAKQLYKQAINYMKSANDAIDKYKEEWYQVIKKAIEEPFSSEHVWKYV